MIQQNIRDVAKAAVAIMQAEGHPLDFSLDSLEMIDDRIEQFRQEGETADSMPATMTGMGIYVGEVLLRTLGRGEWVEDRNLGPWPSLKIGDIVANPIGKCMKRLDSGKADSVRAFAEALVAMAAKSVEEILTYVASNPGWKVTKAKEQMCSR